MIFLPLICIRQTHTINQQDKILPKRQSPKFEFNLLDLLLTFAFHFLGNFHRHSTTYSSSSSYTSSLFFSFLSLYWASCQRGGLNGKEGTHREYVPLTHINSSHKYTLSLSLSNVHFACFISSSSSFCFTFPSTLRFLFLLFRPLFLCLPFLGDRRTQKSGTIVIQLFFGLYFALCRQSETC